MEEAVQEEGEEEAEEEVEEEVTTIITVDPIRDGHCTLDCLIGTVNRFTCL